MTRVVAPTAQSAGQDKLAISRARPRTVPLAVGSPGAGLMAFRIDGSERRNLQTRSYPEQNPRTTELIVQGGRSVLPRYSPCL